jgi:hypothetical protein
MNDGFHEMTEQELFDERPASQASAPANNGSGTPEQSGKTTGPTMKDEALHGFAGEAVKTIKNVAKQAPVRKTFDVVCAANVVMRPKRWLWKGHLLRGAMELLTGIPGLGKSQVHCHYAACATGGATGGPMAPHAATR